MNRDIHVVVKLFLTFLCLHKLTSTGSTHTRRDTISNLYHLSKFASLDNVNQDLSSNPCCFLVLSGYNFCWFYYHFDQRGLIMTSLKSFERPVDRIDYILSEFKTLWRFYPEQTLLGLLMQVTIAANQVDSELPDVSFLDIEEIDYPENNSLSGSRSLEMGFKFLKEELKNKPVPLNQVPVTSLGRVGEIWRRNPHMRLGQLISGNYLNASLEKGVKSGQAITMHSTWRNVKK